MSIRNLGITYGTLAEWLANGWKLDSVNYSQVGYYTRKYQEPEQIPVYVAKGNRSGQPFILEPNFRSTRFCYRRYLVKE